jgi:hypothetical protein
MKTMLSVFGLTLGVACTDGPKEETDAGAAEDGWWEVNGDDKDDDKDDDEKDDDDKDDSEGSFSVDLATGTGWMSVAITGGDPCEVSGVLTGLDEAGGCEACSMAMNLTFSDMESTGGDCDWLLILEGWPMGFGQGAEGGDDVDGLTIYPLYEFDDELPGSGWVIVDEGYSHIDGTNWMFGFGWE